MPFAKKKVIQKEIKTLDTALYQKIEVDSIPKIGTDLMV
jgi:hypothetical protein